MLKVYDVDGRQVFEAALDRQGVSPAGFDWSHLKQGVYFVRFIPLRGVPETVTWIKAECVFANR